MVFVNIVIKPNKSQRTFHESGRSIAWAETEMK